MEPGLYIKEMGDGMVGIGGGSVKIDEIGLELRNELKDNILERYDNVEYWDQSIIDACVDGLSEEQKVEVMKVVEELGVD